MSCEQALELISAKLDGALTPEQEAALAAHLDACPDCKALLEAMEGLETKVSELREPAPEGLKRGVLYRIDQASGKAKKPGRRWFGPGTAIGAVAAVLVLLVGLGVFPGLNARQFAASVDRADHAAESELSDAAADPEEHESTVRAETARRFPSYQPQNAANPDGKDVSTAVLPNGEVCMTEPLPEEPGDDYSGGEGQSDPEPVPVSDELRTQCAAWSREEGALVLLYTEFDAKSLFTVLEREAPALWALTEALEPEDAEGCLRLSTDCGTALAIQEWLLRNLPESEMMNRDLRAAEKQLMSRMDELDPGSGSLYRIITWSPPDHPIQWPEYWPAGWAARLRTEENWAMFFPREDFVPQRDAPALLVFAGG